MHDEDFADFALRDFAPLRAFVIQTPPPPDTTDHSMRFSGSADGLLSTSSIVSRYLIIPGHLRK
jgi:hypothetical protein